MNEDKLWEGMLQLEKAKHLAQIILDSVDENEETLCGSLSLLVEQIGRSEKLIDDARAETA